jgi:exosome complex RNA-binding protein Csl4
MTPVIIDLPYAIRASLEAAAQSGEIGDIVRAALVAIGHGKPNDITGVRSDRFATLDECCGVVGPTPL